MKFKLIILIILSLTLCTDTYAQDDQSDGNMPAITRDNTKDLWSRAAFASFYHETVDVPFNDPKAETYRRLLVIAHRNLLEYPGLVLKSLNNEDTMRLESLAEDLMQLRKSPPSWEKIYDLELKKVKAEKRAMRK